MSPSLRSRSTNTKIVVLILYYSYHGSTRKLAELITQGIATLPFCEARLHTVPAIFAFTEATESSIPTEGAPYVELQDLEECAGLALGSPTRFGNMVGTEVFLGWHRRTLAGGTGWQTGLRFYLFRHSAWWSRVDAYVDDDAAIVAPRHASDGLTVHAAGADVHQHWWHPLRSQPLVRQERQPSNLDREPNSGNSAREATN